MKTLPPPPSTPTTPVLANTVETVVCMVCAPSSFGEYISLVLFRLAILTSSIFAVFHMSETVLQKDVEVFSANTKKNWAVSLDAYHIYI